MIFAASGQRAQKQREQGRWAPEPKDGHPNVTGAAADGDAKVALAESKRRRRSKTKEQPKVSAPHDQQFGDGPAPNQLPVDQALLHSTKQLVVAKQEQSDLTAISIRNALACEATPIDATKIGRRSVTLSPKNARFYERLQAPRPKLFRPNHRRRAI